MTDSAALPAAMCNGQKRRLRSFHLLQMQTASNYLLMRLPICNVLQSSWSCFEVFRESTSAASSVGPCGYRGALAQQMGPSSQDLDTYTSHY